MCLFFWHLTPDKGNTLNAEASPWKRQLLHLWLNVYLNVITFMVDPVYYIYG